MNITVYKNANLIPIAREGVLHAHDLWVEDAILTRIAPTGGGEAIPAGARVIDCSGKYLMPGLIDAHMHLYASYENDLKLLAAYGVTSVRNMWGNQQYDLDTPELDTEHIRQEISAWRITGPTLVNTSRILDGTPTVQPTSRSVNIPVQAMLFINEAKKEGASQLKVYKNLLIEVMDALYDLGTEHGLRIVGHKPDRALAEDFFSKAHSVEHTLTFGLENVRALQRSKCHFVPTLVVEKNMDLLARGELAALKDQGQAYERFLSPVIADLWERLNNEERLARIREWADYDLARRKVARYVELGGIPAVGTDYANPYIYPGISLHEELVLLMECGLSQWQALFAATLQGARVLEIEDRKGTLEIGKDADLLVLNANPLEDIRNTQAIDAVVLRGRYFDRPALDGLLDEAAQDVRDARSAKE
jgi:hypothetical protein